LTKWRKFRDTRIPIPEVTAAATLQSVLDLPGREDSSGDVLIREVMCRRRDRHENKSFEDGKHLLPPLGIEGAADLCRGKRRGAVLVGLALAKEGPGFRLAHGVTGVSQGADDRGVEIDSGLHRTKALWEESSVSLPSGATGRNAGRRRIAVPRDRKGLRRRGVLV
jgi:hypothetical protein